LAGLNLKLQEDMVSNPGISIEQPAEPAADSGTAIQTYQQPANKGQMQAYVHDAAQMVEAIHTLQNKVLKQDVDYGVIPGTGKKPTLLKPGAETLLAAFRLSVGNLDTQIIELGDGHREYRTRVAIVNRAEGNVVGFGAGSCSTMESKYRYRQGERKCPVCGKEAIIKGKAEYGGGWLCFAKKGGCGAKFNEKDQAIIGQEIGRIENPDIADCYNTCLKMSKKRALVDAALTTCAASGVFTQDVEDFADDDYPDYSYHQQAPQQNRQQQQAPPSQQRQPQSAPQAQRQQPAPAQQQQQRQQAAPPAQQQAATPAQNQQSLRKPLITDKLIRVRLGNGVFGPSQRGDVYKWQAQDVSDPLRTDWVWCWHKNLPGEATGSDKPESYQGEVMMRLSRKEGTRKDEQTGNDVPFGYYYVEDMQPCQR
jgi:hypothetical protein